MDGSASRILREKISDKPQANTSASTENPEVNSRHAREPEQRGDEQPDADGDEYVVEAADQPEALVVRIRCGIGRSRRILSTRERLQLPRLLGRDDALRNCGREMVVRDHESPGMCASSPLRV